MRRQRIAGRLVATVLAAGLLISAGPSLPALAASATNLAAGKTATTSGYTDVYPASNVTDGNQATYWESTNNAFPQWVQVDLGSTVGVSSVILKLPTGWGARTQTLTVQGGTDGTTFSTIVASASYVFDPTTSNTVTITTSATTRYVRLAFTANTVWPAGQLSELEVYGPSTGDTQAPTAPTNLAYTQPASGQIKLTWSASTDNVGVTGYDVYANSALRASVAGTVLTYTDSQADSATVAYYVVARDAAGNASALQAFGEITKKIAPAAFSKFPKIRSVQLVGNMALRDKHGNATVDRAVMVKFSRTTAATVKWESIDPVDIVEMADKHWILPELSAGKKENSGGFT